jgi:hypothetical protein
VRNGVHYIAFWPFFGHCGIQPLQILDFCAHIRKILMKMQKLRTHHFSSVHYIKHYTFLHKHVKIADTTLFLYKCHHQFSYTKMSKLRTLHFSYTKMSKLRTTLFLIWCPLYQNTTHCYTNMSKLRTTPFLIWCPLYKNTTNSLHKHAKTADYTFSYLVSTISKHYQSAYTNMPKLRTTLFLI